MPDEKKKDIHGMLFIPQHLVSQCEKVVEKEFLFIHVSTAQPEMCSTLRRRQKKQETINLADVSRYLKPFAPLWLPCSPPL